jgi:hypothetical protein
MVTIGGKSRKASLPAQPQVVIQRANFTNEFALIGLDDRQQATIAWVGDPNAATKFNSKYEAKSRVRDFEDVPESRVFKVLGEARR